MGLIPGSKRCPEVGNGNPLQYSCLVNSMDRRTWWATAHGVSKSWMRLSTCTHTLTIALFTVVYPWKQPKCPSVDEWRKCVCVCVCVCVYTYIYIHRVEYYSVIKKWMKSCLFVTIQMYLESIKQNKSEKTNAIWSHLYTEYKKKQKTKKLNDIENRLADWWLPETEGSGISEDG